MSVADAHNPYGIINLICTINIHNNYVHMKKIILVSLHPNKRKTVLNKSLFALEENNPKIII